MTAKAYLSWCEMEGGGWQIITTCEAGDWRKTHCANHDDYGKFHLDYLTALDQLAKVNGVEVDAMPLPDIFF